MEGSRSFAVRTSIPEEYFAQCIIKIIWWPLSGGRQGRTLRGSLTTRRRDRGNELRLELSVSNKCILKQREPGTTKTRTRNCLPPSGPRVRRSRSPLPGCDVSWVSTQRQIRATLKGGGSLKTRVADRQTLESHLVSALLSEETSRFCLTS